MSAMASIGLVGVSTQTTLVRPGPDRRADGVEVGQVRRSVCSTPHGPATAREEPVGAAVGVVGDDDVVAGAEHGAQHGVLGGEAGGEGERRARRPSSAARHSSSAVRVGLALRLYS